MAEQETAYKAEAVQVGVRGIDTELARQWQSAAGGSGGSGAITRVILSNLLVYSSSDKDADEAMNVMADVIAAHPSRAVVVDDEPNKGIDTNKAFVSMVCSMGERGRRLCGEAIRIHAHGPNGAVLGTVMPIMVPDLPTILWMPSDVAWGQTFLRSLLQVCDEWVVDSRKFTDWADRFELVRTLAGDEGLSLAVYDLAWVSLLAWRDAIARMFDYPAAREYLLGVNEITIKCGQREDGLPHVSAMLILAWLACLLGWEVGDAHLDGGKWRVGFAADSRQLSAVLETSPDARQPVESVVIASERDGRSGVFAARLTDQADAVAIDINAPDVATVAFAARIMMTNLAAELTTALNGPASDILYKRMLPVITDLASKFERAGSTA